MGCSLHSRGEKLILAILCFVALTNIGWYIFHTNHFVFNRGSLRSAV